MTHTQRSARTWPVWLTLACLFCLSIPAAAQDNGGFLLQEFSGKPGLPEPDDKVTFEAGFTVEPDGRTGTLQVTARVIPNWHIFSVTQPDGGPQRTELEIATGFADARLTGPFQPDSDFHAVEYEFYDVPGEEHEGTVVWSAPIAFADGVIANELSIPVQVQAQVCQNGDGGACLVYSPELSARSMSGPRVFVREVHPDQAKTAVRGWVDKTHAQPGDRVNLNLQLEPETGWMIPAFSEQPGTDHQSTLVVFTKRNDAAISPPEASRQPEVIGTDATGLLFHNQPVTWQFPIDLPTDMQPGEYAFKGWVGFNAEPESLASGGDTAPPSAVQFSFQLDVGTSTVMAENDLEFFIPETADYGEVATLAQQEFERIRANAGAFSEYPILAVLGLAFVAGLILNVMPCVLPVIGIKVLSLVQQAGENPRRILMMNLVFAAGIISVFLLLATLATFPQILGKKIGWGGLFESQAFVITMIAVVFAFALSFLGVWEIPIPGFVSTAGSGKAARQEGYAGAFLKGVLTTLLATPCSGPLLIPAVTWATAQPPALTYLVFLALGLGMAFPFIMIGFKPELVSWLPKPGEWMETFKQLMGFVLIGAALFFFNPITEKYQIPVLAFLLFIGMACWMAGRISFVDPAAVRFRKWMSAVALVVLGAVFSFYLMIPQYELDWQDFSRSAVDEQVALGHVVFVDFTADW